MIPYSTQTIDNDDIEAVKEQVDVLIVAMHWGIEYQTNPICVVMSHHLDL